MRTIHFAQHPREGDDDYAHSVRMLLARDEVWEQACRERMDGRDNDFRLRLISYEAPDTGRTTWAVFYENRFSRTLREYEGYDEAEMVYDQIDNAIGDASGGLPAA